MSDLVKTAAPAVHKQTAPASIAGLGTLQRKCACGGTPGPSGECESCRKKRQGLQRQAAAPAGPATAPPIVHEVLASAGRPLDGATRTFMETRMGHDFSQVRVHSDGRAAELARAVSALAYTVGRNIVFGAGHYAPGTGSGQRLLAHELAHVAQQGGSGTALQPQLAIGATDDPAEAEADRAAERVMSLEQAGPVGVTRGPSSLRRTPEGPQRVGADDRRKVALPVQQRGEEQVRVHVLRTLVACPCRKVDDVRTGIFYNPDLDNLTIAYRHCRGRRTTDVFTTLESNATAFLQGQAPPTGTARIGVDINVAGRAVGGRVILEAIGTNEGPSGGIGGRAQVVFQNGRWRVFLDPQFIRRLGSLSEGGTTPNELQLSLGAQFGGVTLRVELNNLLDPALRRGRGTVCIPAGAIGDICPFIEASEGGGVTGGIGLNIPFGGPEVRPEECFQCLCPPPTRRYECIEDVLPSSRPVTEEVPVQRQREFRYYFRLDRTSPSEDPALSAQSTANLSALAAEVRAGGEVSFIFGYASPEATERHNDTLGADRATRMRELIQQQVGTGVQLPEPNGAGELLGSRPAPSPSSRLGDAIRAGGFRSAGRLTPFLIGEEIPNAELSEQFISLFNALPEPADRLAVFGLTVDDAIAPQVLAAVGLFMRSRGRGYRPWERIFRLLRVGVARVSRTEMVPQTRTVETSGSVARLTNSQCKSFAREAEATGEFGPIDPSAQTPSTSSEDRDFDCREEPQREDTARGCRYELPSALRGRATAPERAPRELR